MTEKGPEMKNPEKYQQVIGALLYIAVNTRPYITASINILSQHNKNPRTADWNDVRRVLRYLKGTVNRKLILGESNANGDLIGYADADWAENLPDRKSHSGYIFKVHGVLIS